MSERRQGPTNSHMTVTADSGSESTAGQTEHGCGQMPTAAPLLLNSTYSYGARSPEKAPLAQGRPAPRPVQRSRMHGLCPGNEWGAPGRCPMDMDRTPEPAQRPSPRCPSRALRGPGRMTCFPPRPPLPVQGELPRTTQMVVRGCGVPEQPAIRTPRGQK